jgi:arsenate reductase (thioredoxin)
MRLALGVSLVVSACVTAPRAQRVGPDSTVVFVCEHGNVKSVIAAALFNREASARHLGAHAVARGVTPEPSVPTAIATKLQAEGDDVRAFRPSTLGNAEVQAAQRVVAISVDPATLSAAGDKLEVWNDVPPASVDYSASRAALLRHIDTLLSQLTP